MAYKGKTPSELYERYNCEGGTHRLELDLIIAAEINERITESSNANKDGKSMVARRNQKREQRQLLNNNADMLKALRDANVPIVGSNDSGDAE